MAQVYYLDGRLREQSVFDYLYRKIPFGGGYVIFAGLEELLDIILALEFSADDLEFLKAQGFQDSFLDYLQGFEFSGSIYAMQEGDLVFPLAPILQLHGNLIEAQILETLLLNVLNFQSLVATKASRMRHVAGDKTLIDFGLRRSHGPASYYASRAAIVGGFDGTSHVLAGRDFQIPVSGTMAHSFVQSYPSELEAFRAYAKHQADACVLLVDTYDTLRQGVPNAILVAKELQSRGKQLVGIRLDSGDLAYLARESRKMLDKAGLTHVKIAVSNQLDEYIIRSLHTQHAPIDIYGVGTSLVTGQPDGALDGVYKMSLCNDRPNIKLSENIEKTTLPGKKQVYRLCDADGKFRGGDLIGLQDEGEQVNQMHHPTDPYASKPIISYDKRPMLQAVMENGKRCLPKRSLFEIAKYCQNQISHLPDAFKRFENPHRYQVGISTKLRDQRNALIEEFSK